MSHGRNRFDIRNRQSRVGNRFDNHHPCRSAKRILERFQIGCDHILKLNPPSSQILLDKERCPAVHRLSQYNAIAGLEQRHASDRNGTHALRRNNRFLSVV